MRKYNPTNERIKREFFIWLKEAKRQSEASVDAAAKAISRFEIETKYRDFKMFHINQVTTFKQRMTDQQSQKTGETLSKATLHSTFAHLKRFFLWLAGQHGYKSHLKYSDAEYFNFSEKGSRVANATREKKSPTMDQLQHVLLKMPATSEIERRNRAIFAFTMLTAARVSAIASLKLKHIDLVEGSVFQDAREVDTKFSKTFKTVFIQDGPEARAMFDEWVNYLRQTKLWGESDPLFPTTSMTLDQEKRFAASGIARSHWASTGPIREIFKEAFSNASIPYFNPHSFRDTLGKLGLQRCKSAEEFKAWSQNLGHEGVMTTFTSYGQVDAERQREIIRLLNEPRSSSPGDMTEQERKWIAAYRQISA